MADLTPAVAHVATVSQHPGQTRRLAPLVAWIDHSLADASALFNNKSMTIFIGDNGSAEAVSLPTFAATASSSSSSSSSCVCHLLVLTLVGDQQSECGGEMLRASPVQIIMSTRIDLEACLFALVSPQHNTSHTVPPDFRRVC